MRKNLRCRNFYPAALLHRPARSVIFGCAFVLMSNVQANANPTARNFKKGTEKPDLAFNGLKETGLLYPFGGYNKAPAENAPADHVVYGVVTDETGNPLQAVSVQVKGINQVVITNSSGNFSLNVPDNAVLSISFIGYQTQEITVGTKNYIAIQLKVTAADLNEVVVVGYGTQKKANLTGAVSQVTSEVLENRSIPNLTQGLQGHIPNLNITMLDGKPIQSPAYNVRGTTSIGQGGNALVLVDGVEGDPSLINPNDVASVTVLKDASSAAIYGARGAFGVVLITTKSAKKGKTSVSYSSNYSLKSPTAIPDQVNNGYLYAKMFSEAYSAGSNYTQLPKNINKTQTFSQEYLDAFKEHDENPSLPKID